MTDFDDSVPFYFIYREAPRALDPRFVHVETVMARGALHHGDVRPHRHAELHQMMLWFAGRGRFHIEAEEIGFAAPSVVIMPAGTVHGFRVARGSDALVVSVSEDFRRAAIGDDDASLLGDSARPALIDLRRVPGVSTTIADHFAAIERELKTAGPHRLATLEAHWRLALIAATRVNQSHAPQRITQRSSLFERFRAMLERHFHEDWPVARYATMLATTGYGLNKACREATGRGAQAQLNERRLIEAKRLLLYGRGNVAEIAHAVGLDDPAYFSRFFKRHEGVSPNTWRARKQA